jgi:uncharacterized transporter YbjL
MMGTASGALLQLDLSADVLKQWQAKVAAGYAVTYICGYILVLLFVPLVAPLLMRTNLKEEAAKLEAALASGKTTGSLVYRRLQARAYQVSVAAGRTLKQIESQIGRRVVIERILRGGEDVEPRPDVVLQADDDVLVAGPTAALVDASRTIGHEIDSENIVREVAGDTLEVFVTARNLHGRTLEEIVEHIAPV